MADFKALISLIGNAVNLFNSNIPGIQKKMLDDILLLSKQLDVKDDKIRIAGSNLRLLSQVQGRLQKVLLNPQYTESIKSFVSNFDDVVKLQNNYYRELENKFQPPKLVKEIKRQAIQSVVTNLTETGLNANIVDKIHSLMRQAATSGGSYNTLTGQLTDFIVNNASGEGQLLKYTKQMTTDALSQFSGQYSQLISSDLGFEWFRYSGSNIETSRPFCLACTDRKFFHISEMPKILKGDFDEFRKHGGKVNKKTELPEGMIPGTDVTNFMTYRGGYNCGHMWRPCSDDIVPNDIKQRVYSSPAYSAWARLNGKAVTHTPPAEEKKQSDERKQATTPVSKVVSTIKENNQHDLDKLEKKGVVFYEDLAEHWPEDVKIISREAAGSFYRPDTKTMVIGGGDRSKNDYYKKKIMAHEGGHAMHLNDEIITMDKVAPEFQKLFSSLQDIIKGKEGDLDRELWNLGHLHSDDQTKTEQIIILHDTIGGLTRGEYGSGHSRNYYQTGNFSEMEVFAHAITLAKLENEFSEMNETVSKLTTAMKGYATALLKK